MLCLAVNDCFFFSNMDVILCHHVWNEPIIWHQFNCRSHDFVVPGFQCFLTDLWRLVYLDESTLPQLKSKQKAFRYHTILIKVSFNCFNCQLLLNHWIWLLAGNNKRYIFRYNLETHSVTHSGIRNHKCPICQKSFSTKSSLKNHTAIHSEERLFQCEVCAKTFKTNRRLYVHKFSHATEEKYQCEICLQKFR